MSQLPRYESYKDSGVQWLGEIPSHWDVIRLKFILEVKKNAIKVGPFGSDLKGDDFQTSGYPVYNQRTVLDNDFFEGTAFISEEKFKALVGFKIEPFDILVTTRGTIGKIAVAPEDVNDGIIHPCIMKFSINRHEITDQLLKYLFNEIDYVFDQFVLASGTTTIPVIYSDTLKNVVLPLPPITEQKIIVDFLDKRLAQVDALIAKQETLLEKLAEQRVALISHAVTKGLNPDVEMKESGVEWLGQVPSHWIDTKFKYYVYFQEGPGILAVDFRTEGVPLIRISGLKDNTVTLNGCNFLDENKVKETWNHFKLTKKDMIISASASLSEACEVTDEAIGAIPYTGLIKVRPQQESLLKSYLKIFLSSRFFYEQVSILQTGATIQHYGPAHLRQISILVPPIEEQAKVVEHVEKAVSEINALTSKVVKTLETLREYRSTLITQVVTGKIDVRNLKVN